MYLPTSTSSPIIEQRHPPLDVAVAITQAGFKLERSSPELVNDVASHLDGGDLVYTLSDPTGILGFAIFKIWRITDDCLALYLSGIILKPDHQHRQLTKVVVDMARVHTAQSFGRAPTHLCYRTANSTMWRGAIKATGTGEHFPNAQSGVTIPDGSCGQVAQYMARQLGAPVHSLRHIGGYGQPLYGTQPTVSDPDTQAIWDGFCDFARGDAIMCVGAFR